MTFTNNLIHGIFIKRYKRFLADVLLNDGTIVTAHCTNSGSMLSCLEEGADVYLSPSENKLRKTRFTWEMIKINNNWVGVNTSNPNKLIFEAIKNKEIKGLDNYTIVTCEVKFGESRLDIYAENETEKCAIEVKNVTLKDGNRALFPDARTERGLKHLNTLIRLKKSGIRSVMVYVIQRMDVSVFGIASSIDPEYSKTLLKAVSCGVEIFPLQAKVTPEGISIIKKLEFDLA